MKIFQQLNNEELPEVILGSGQRWLQRQVGDLPDALPAAVQRPETFWQSQQAANQSRIASGSRVALFSMRALAQTYALAFAPFALALLRTGPATVPIPAPTQAS